jgi:cytochrome c
MRRLIPLLALCAATACGSGAEQHRLRHAKDLIANHCAACHQVPGVALAQGRVGPSLAGIGQQQIIAGYFANSPEMLTQWIEHPQRMLPGNAMPELGLTHEQAMSIVDYLYTMEKRP